MLLYRFLKLLECYFCSAEFFSDFVNIGMALPSTEGLHTHSLYGAVLHLTLTVADCLTPFPTTKQEYLEIEHYFSFD